MRKRFLWAAAGWLAVPVFASNVEINHKSRDLNKVKEELNRKQQEKERLRREADELSEQLKAGEVKLKSIEDALLNTRRRTIAVEQEMASSKNKHDHLIGGLEETKRQMRTSLRSYYVASVLASSEAPFPVYTRQAFHSQVGRYANLQRDRDEEHARLEHLVQANQVLRGELSRQETSRRSVRHGLDDKGRLLSKKLTRREALEAEVRELQQTAEELASLIDIMRSRAKKEEEQEKKARLEKQASGHSPIPSGSLPWPVAGKIVTRFGRQQHPELGIPFISNGIVIALRQAEPVHAVADGRVLYAGQFMSYGFMAVLEHPGDWYTVYGHLARWNVEKGQNIKKGDVVGMAGAKSGGGAEAYFELRFYGKPTDPLPWLSH